MTLNKRYLRNVKDNISFYISIILLTAVVIALYLGLAAAYVQEKAYLDDNEEKVRTEDAQFTTYIPLSDEDIEELHKEYGVEIEQQLQSDVEANVNGSTVTIRLLRSMENINRYALASGREPESGDEIMLSPLFADRNGTKVGDVIEFNSKKYTVVGLFIRFDYLFCLKNYTDTFSNSDSFGLGIVSNEEFDRIKKEDVASYYSLRFEGANEYEIRRAINDSFMTQSYTGSETNNRIATPKDQLEELRVSMGMIVPMSVILIVILIAIVLGRKIKNEQKQIGILNALGYKKRELAMHYSFFGVILGVCGALLGVVAGSILIEPMAELYIEGKIEILPIKYTVTIKDIILSLFVPTIVYVIAIFITAYAVMNNDVISMIKGLAKEGRRKKGMRMSGMRLSFRSKYRIRAVFGHFSRTLVVIVGIGLGGTLLAFGYACVDSLDRYVNESVDATGDFEYEYFLNSLSTEKPSHGEGLLAANLEVRDYKDLVTIMGMDKAEYIRLETPDGKRLDIAKGKFYISEMCSYIYNVKAGDTLTLMDVASLEEISITVDEVFENGSQNLIVTDNATLCGLFGLPKGTINTVMSDTKLSYSDSELSKVVIKQEISDQIRNNIAEGMHKTLGALIVFGGVIELITTYLMVNMLLMENTTAVSMLKVLGYRDGEINSVVTHIYHLLLPFGLIFGLIAGIVLNKVNFEKSTAVYNTYISPYIKPSSILFYSIVIIASYMLSVFLLNRKVRRIEMVESLRQVN